MEINDGFYSNTRDYQITARISETEIQRYGEQIQTFLLRRFVDTLYEEMLPIVREAVLKAFEPATIAKHIEAEMQMALTAALGRDK